MVNIIPNRADTMEQPDRKVRPVNKPPPLSSCHNRDADDFANASVGGFQPVDQHPENFPFTSVTIQPEADICSGCGGYILDRYVNVTTKPKDQQHQRELGDGGDVQTWHSDCLKCLKCSVALAPLDGNFKPTCYMRGDQPHCKACYQRLFGIKCARCSRVIHATDWVRRARQLVYHLACFACDSCKRQLSTGEEFALQEFKVLCKQHYMELLEGDSGKAHQKQKTKRVRTTFTEEQLQILQANFQIDSNPDGQDLERIAQITGLSKRVTQVWFQNSRARQKKYQGGKGKVHGGQPGGEPGCHGDMMMPDSPCSGNVSLSDSVTRELDDDVISDDCGVSSRCYDNASPVMDTTSSMESLHHHHA